MRKLTCALLCLLMILSTTFYLTGCKSRTDEMADLETYTTKQMTKTKKQVIKCINEQDKEGLKKLFSKDAQKHIEDLGQLDQFINAFNGNKIESKKGRDPNFEGSAQAQPLHIFGKYHLKLSNGDKYILFINTCDIDEDNKDREGIYQLVILTFSSDEVPDDFRMEGTNNDYGIFIYSKDGTLL